MPPRRYKSVEECRPEIQEFIDELEAGTDDDDDEMRSSSSLASYAKDLRWYDHFLDGREIDSVLDVDVSDSNALGRTLSSEFNGTTGRHRWDVIKRFHGWLVAIELREKNPLLRWDDQKRTKWGLSKKTQQEREEREEEEYPVSQDEVRLMEQHVGPRHRIRDQLLIRICWQCGLRRGEASQLELRDIDRENREITIRKDISKSKYTRVVAYQPSLDGLLTKWLDGGYRNKHDPEGNQPYLFVSERGKRLRGERINEIVREAAIEAGINRRTYHDGNSTHEHEDGNRWRITSHNLRVGFATYLVNETDAGLWEVSRQLGHSSVAITEKKYVKADKRAGIDHTRKYGPD